MAKLRDLIVHLQNEGVRELLLSSGFRPRIRKADGLEELDDGKLSSDSIVQLLFAAGGSRHVEGLGARAKEWTTRVDPIGLVQVSALMRGGDIEATIRVAQSPADAPKRPRVDARVPREERAKDGSAVDSRARDSRAETDSPPRRRLSTQSRRAKHVLEGGGYRVGPSRPIVERLGVASPAAAEKRAVGSTEGRAKVLDPRSDEDAGGSGAVDGGTLRRRPSVRRRTSSQQRRLVPAHSSAEKKVDKSEPRSGEPMLPPVQTRDAGSVEQRVELSTAGDGLSAGLTLDDNSSRRAVIELDTSVHDAKGAIEGERAPEPVREAKIDAPRAEPARAQVAPRERDAPEREMDRKNQEPPSDRGQDLVQSPKREHPAIRQSISENERPSSIPPAPRVPAIMVSRAPLSFKPDPSIPPKPARGRHGQEFERLLTEARRAKATDLHLIAGRPPVFRIAGELCSFGKPLDPETVASMTFDRMPDNLWPRFHRHGSCDFALGLQDGRFRINITRQRTGIKVSARIVPNEVPTLSGLGLPPEIAKAAQHHQGLIVISGPTGHGKTSTMAALVDLINENTTHHVITVEDPIEYVHRRKSAIVSQREVGTHTKTFGAALKASLREDPDVIVVGELRDTETVEMALSASETGHLVLGTMNTPSAAKTIDRLIDLFPPGDQGQVRATLAGGLRMIVSQRLLPTKDRTSLVAAAEVLPGTLALWNLIRDSKTFQIPSLQQRGKGAGVIRLNDSLAELVRSGRVNLDDAKRVADNPEELANMVRSGAQEPMKEFDLKIPNRPQPVRVSGDDDDDDNPGWLKKAGSLFKR